MQFYTHTYQNRLLISVCAGVTFIVQKVLPELHQNHHILLVVNVAICVMNCIT